MTGSDGRPHYYLPPARYVPAPPEIVCDVCVYGATSAGVAAAVQAADMGKSVCLLELGRNVGGMTTSGLGATDTGHKQVIGGLSRRFYRDVGRRYGKRIGWEFEPHVAAEVYAEWLRDRGIRARFGEPLAGVARQGARIQSVTSGTGLTVRAKVYIDGSYEGDLMARAGVSYTVGRESDLRYSELFNGVQYGHQHTFLHFVDPYCAPGDPTSGRLPGVSDIPLGRQGDGDTLIQAYNFRLCLTREPRNRVPFPRPDGYDPDDYELLRRYIDVGVFDVFNLNREIPGGKTDHNNWGAVNTDYIGGNYGWPDGTYEERERIFQDHVRYDQGLFHFLGTDNRLPEEVRRTTSAWGLAADEFRETGNWPPELYIREARRMVSDYVLTEHDSFGRDVAEDPVGMASYRMDSHNCKRTVYAGRAVNEGDVEVVPLDPVPISYRAIRPRRSECENLLVPVCASCSHIAFGMIRMEPVFMILGQSAGAAAALAIDRAGGVVQDVPYAGLKKVLEDAGQVLEDPNIAAKRQSPGGGQPVPQTRYSG